MVEPKAPLDNIHDYKWPRIDKIVKIVQNTGRKMQVNIGAENSWAIERNGQKAVRIRPEYIDDYAAFIKALVERYDADGKEDMEGPKYGITHLQIESEPLNDWQNVDGYLEVLKTAFEAAKSASSKVVIMASGWNIGDLFEGDPDNEEISRRFSDPKVKRYIDFQKKFIKDGKDYFDILSLHLNRGHESIYKTVEWWRKEMDLNGYQKPIWSEDTSSGPFLTSEFSSDQDRQRLQIMENPKDPQYQETIQWFRNEQSKLLIKKALRSFAAGIEKVFISSDVDWPEYKMPIWRHMGLIGRSGELRPAFYTYKLLISKIDGFSSIETMQEENGIYIYEFRKQGKPIWVAWNDNSQEKQITISGIASNQAKITKAVPKYETGKEVTDYNTAFNTETKSVSGGKITITLGDVPIFMEGK